jgi:hypothetical protein
MMKLLLSLFIVVPSVTTFAKPIAQPSIFHPDSWVKYMDKDADEQDTVETFILTGTLHTTVHGPATGFFNCFQYDGEYPSNAPWTLGFASLYTNDIHYDVSGYISSGTSVSVPVDVHAAMNSDGTSAWEGWYYGTENNQTDKQYRKVEWKFYDLPLIAD